MSVHTRKRHTKTKGMLRMSHLGHEYLFPCEVAELYRVEGDEPVSAEKLFRALNKVYTKPGALLKGLRMREGLTQTQLAKKLMLTQSDVSQMENGVRNIGRKVAQRIEKLFDVDYRAFLE